MSALLCSCNSETPPNMERCGKYPAWCLIFKCRSRQCKGKKKWSVCIRCINVISPNEKMYWNPQLSLHNELHRLVHQQTASSTTNRNEASASSAEENQLLHLESIHAGLMANVEYYRAFEQGNAMQYLVARQFQPHNLRIHVISETDAQLHTLIAYVSLSQSKQENAKFAWLLKLIDTNNKSTVQELINERNFYRYVMTECRLSCYPYC
jgi:hypothetical protein